jgi:hypothetical protein
LALIQFRQRRGSFVSLKDLFSLDIDIGSRITLIGTDVGHIGKVMLLVYLSQIGYELVFGYAWGKGFSVLVSQDLGSDEFSGLI